MTNLPLTDFDEFSQELLMDVKTLAKILEISIPDAFALIEKGELTSVRTCGNVYVRARDLGDYLRTSLSPGKGSTRG